MATPKPHGRTFKNQTCDLLQPASGTSVGMRETVCSSDGHILKIEIHVGSCPANGRWATVKLWVPERCDFVQLEALGNMATPFHPVPRLGDFQADRGELLKRTNIYLDTIRRQ